jgi:hypothetical protein
MPSSEVMSKWKAGNLHSGSKKGPVVKNRAQAIAIKMSEQRKEKANGGRYPESGLVKLSSLRRAK